MMITLINLALVIKMMMMVMMMMMMMREQSDYPAGLSNRASLGSSYVSRVVSNA